MAFPFDGTRNEVPAGAIRRGLSGARGYGEAPKFVRLGARAEQCLYNIAHSPKSSLRRRTINRRSPYFESSNSAKADFGTLAIFMWGAAPQITPFLEDITLFLETHWQKKGSRLGR
jgi:hypothetical protein